MEQGYSSTDLTWGIALHMAIGVVISISIFIQGIRDEGTIGLLLLSLALSGSAILISIFIAIPIGLINGNKISKPIESAKCSALSCGIGFAIMWVMISASFMASISMNLESGNNTIFLKMLPYALFGIASAAMGAAAAFISNSMVFHHQLPVVAAQPAVQVANVQSAIAPSYVSTSDTVSGGRDLYDWEVAEKKHEDRLARIPRM